MNKSIIREAIHEAVHEVIREEEKNEYQKFVDSVMDMAGIDDPDDLTDEGKQNFFSLIDAHYDEEDDTSEEVTKDDLAAALNPEQYKDDSKVPDFIEDDEVEEIRKITREAVREVLSELK